MGTLVRVLLLSLPFASLLSCKGDPEETPVSVADPVEITLDRSAPQVRDLLNDLLLQARINAASGDRRGELGMAYEVNGYADAALASYAQAELLDGDEARWPYYQALILGPRGEQRRALSALDRTIDIDAAYAPAWMWRGTWSLDLGLVDQAGEAFTRAESLGQGWVARAGRARVLLHQHRSDEAVALLEPLSRDAGIPSVFQLLGRACRAMGRLEDARVAAARGKLAEPLGWEDAWASMKLSYAVGFRSRVLDAQRLMLLGQKNEAIDTLESLLKEKPEDPEVLTMLSRAYTQVGEMDRAFWTLRRAIERPPVHYTVHLDIAGFYEARGDLETALKHLDRALELNPAVAGPYTTKGLLLKKQRRHEEALAAFESALRRDASDPNLFFYAGDEEAALKRWPRAIQRFEESVRIDPSFTAGHLKLGLALAQTRRLAESRAALTRAKELGTHDQVVERALARLTELEKRSQ